MKSLGIPVWPLVLVFAFQLFLLTWGQAAFGLFVSPVLIWMAGLFLGFYPLLVKGKSHQANLKHVEGRTHQFIGWGFFVVGLLVSAWLFVDVLGDFPIDPARSDIIPSIQKMYMDRLWQGESIYQPYAGFGYAFFPTYLPLFWLPFTVTNALNIDHRWMAFFILSVALFVVQWRVSCGRGNPLQRIITPVLLWSSYFIFLTYNRDMVGHTLESMIGGYYLLFAVSLFWRKSLVKSIPILLTLLSRFSNLFFLPFYALVVGVKESWKKVFGIGGIVAAGVILLYVIPFLSQDWSIFSKSMDYYTSATEYEWLPRGGLDHPYHLNNGVGMAYWFYALVPGALADKIFWLRIVQVALSVGGLAVFGLFWRRISQVGVGLFLLCALQVYLANFYSFVQIPYAYLFIVPVMVSAYLILEVMRHNRCSLAEEAVFDNAV